MSVEKNHVHSPSVAQNVYLILLFNIMLQTVVAPRINIYLFLKNEINYLNSNKYKYCLFIILFPFFAMLILKNCIYDIYRNVFYKKSPCCICLDNITSGHTRLACDHDFHKSCIIKWQEINHTCPLCRESLISSLQHFPNQTILTFCLTEQLLYIWYLYLKGYFSRD